MIARINKLPVSILCVLFVLGILLAWWTWIFTHPAELSKLKHDCINPLISAQQCYEEYYTQLAKTSGVRVALRTLNEHRGGDYALAGACHNTMHVIGRIAFHEFGSLGRAYELADYSCWSGYYHGVVEGALRGKKSSDVPPDALRAVCTDIRATSTNSFQEFNCVHGLGHALMYITTNDIPASLLRCEDLQNDWAIGHCSTGVFMENTLANDDDHASRFIPTDDLNFPCTIVPERHKEACYLVQGEFIITRTRGDFAKAFAFCETITTTGLRTQCARGLGKKASEYGFYEPLRARAFCSVANPPLEDDCIFGVLQDLAGASGSRESGVTLCNNEPNIQKARCEEILYTTEHTTPIAR